MFSIFVQIKKAALLVLFSQPGKGFLLKFFRNVDSTQLSAFGIKVEMAELNMFNLDLNSSLTLAPVAARKRITKYQNISLSFFRQDLKYS